MVAGIPAAIVVKSTAMNFARVRIARKYVLREIVKQTCGDQQMADPGCQKMPKSRPRPKCFLVLCGVPLWNLEMMTIGVQL